jgi:hypothetical protein
MARKTDRWQIREIDVLSFQHFRDRANQKRDCHKRDAKRTQIEFRLGGAIHWLRWRMSLR